MGNGRLIANVADSMGKFGWAVIVVLGAALAADQYLNYGYYTDSTLTVLGQIKRSFGW